MAWSVASEADDEQCDLERSISLRGSRFSLNDENENDCLAADKSDLRTQSQFYMACS